MTAPPPVAPRNLPRTPGPARPTPIAVTPAIAATARGLRPGFATQVKAIGFSVARAAGAFWVLRRSAWRRARLLILTYHGVSLHDEHEWSTLYVSADHLERRLAKINALGYRIRPLGEALDAVVSGALEEPTVSITFDDGAHDFAARAYPLLQRYNAPVMLYQTTYYTDFQAPVFDTVMSYMMWKARGRTVPLPLVDATVSIPESQHSAEFFAIHNAIVATADARHLTGAEKDAIARDFARRACVDYDEIVERRMLFMMSAEELRHLDPALVDIQLHTHRHRSPRDRTLFRRELIDNATALARITQRGVRREHFCYPSGDHDPVLRQHLAEHGIRTATTCEAGLVTSATDLLMLPRFVDTMPIHGASFEAWLCGAATLVPRRASNS
jgi:peptidoglycan/xylan/chitin deacetylase (PgdA/CDA1 family)